MKLKSAIDFEDDNDKESIDSNDLLKDAHVVGGVNDSVYRSLDALYNVVDPASEYYNSQQ